MPDESDNEKNETVVTAVEARTHLFELEAERALAIDVGIGAVDAYMADLDQEIEVWRQYYVVSAVTEIAILRGELSGRNVG
jgi:hypothetical protein